MSSVSAEPPNGAQIDVDDAVLDRADMGGNLGRRLELDRVPLPVAEAEGVDVEPVARGDGGDGGGVESAGQQHDGRFGSRMPPQA